MHKVGFAYDNYMLLHENHKYSHPERPSRIMAIYQNLEKVKLLPELERINFEPVNKRHLLRVHDEHLIDRVDDSIYNAKALFEGKQILKVRGETKYMDESYDVYANLYTKECAYLAAGASVASCDAVFSEVPKVDSVFAAIRPPGHHASCEKMAGFCLFNNAAVAARSIQVDHNIKKVCIFDWDIHVGDGTSQIFYEDDSILYISLHRYDDGMFYPGKAGSYELIGKDAGKGYNIHYAFNEYSAKEVSDKEYAYACQNLLFPIIQEFKPEAILISCGFDSAKGDPLGQIGVTPYGYAWMTYGLMQICPKIVVLLEGGYNLDALANSSEAVIRTLKIDPKSNDDEDFNEYSKSKLNQPLTHKEFGQLSMEKPIREFTNVYNKLLPLLKPYWKCLQGRE
eukprot:403366593